MERITVDAQALRQVLQALIGPPHLIRELQVLRRLESSPIDKLVNEFNAEVAKEAEDGKKEETQKD